MSDTRFQGLANRWWTQLPVAAARYSRVIGSGLTDGIHWLQWPTLAATAPLVALIAGMLAAFIQPGHTFTTSLIVVSVFVIAAAFGVLAGAMTWLGYVAIDLFFNPIVIRPFSVSVLERWVGAPVGQLIEYLLLAVIAVGIPLTTLAVRVEIRAHGWYRALADPVERLVAVGTWTMLVYFWVRALPVLIRPPFTYQGVTPTTDAVVPVQERWWIPVAVAALAMGGRVIAERRATGPAVVDAIRNLAESLSAIAESKRLPTWLVRGVGAVATTLLLGGLITNVVAGLAALIVLGAGAAAAAAIRQRGLLQPIARVPLLVRYLAGLALTFLIVNLTLQFASSNSFGGRRITTDSFTWPLIGAVLSIVVLAVLTAPVRTVETEEKAPV